MADHAIMDAIKKFHIVAGVSSNCLLLYLIRRHTRLNLGAYKQLLTIFASVDLFLIILHGIVDPMVLIVDKTTFGVVADSFIEDRRLTSFYCTSFTIPFALMNIHFLFRYWTVQKPHLIDLFSRRAFIFILVSIPLIEWVTWYLLCYFGSSGDDNDVGTELLRSTFEKKFGKRIEGGWLVLDHWRDGVQLFRFTLTIVMFNIVMVLSFSLALSLGAITYFALRDAKKISNNARLLQLKLLIAVTAQTVVPLLFVYIPYAVVLNFPYFDLSAGPMGEMCMLLTSCFPAWDAVIIISLMTDYREAVLKMTMSQCRSTTSSTIRNAVSGMTTTRIGSINYHGVEIY